MSHQSTTSKFSKNLIFTIFTLLFVTQLVFAQLQEQQPLYWLAKAQSQFSADAWKKIPVKLQLLIDAPTDFLEMKAKSIEILKIGSSEPEVGLLVKSVGNREELEALGARVGCQLGDIFTVRIPIHQLSYLAELPQVLCIEPSMKLKSTLDSSVVENMANLVHQGNYTTSPPTYSGYTGKDVLVGTIDTGIDWKHGTFINDNDGKSRVLYLWDQRLSPLSSEHNPDGFYYGVEYTQTDINDEIDGSPKGYVRSKDVDAHGTHVMGVIAGDGSTSGGGISPYTYVGMAPQSDILMIRSELYFSQIIDGLYYAMEKADKLGKPLVINMSLGTQASPHDGSTLPEQAINNAVNTGKVTVVVSAGNEGTDTAHGEYIHAEGTVTAGASHTTNFVVPTYTANSGGGNDLILIDLWYQGGDNITVKVTTPNGYYYSANTGSNNNSYLKATADGAIFIDNASLGKDINNDDRECYIQIWDYYSNQPPKAGTWTITVTGNTIAEGGSYDSWIYASQVGNNLVYYTATSGSNRKVIGCPGTAEKVITVGCYSTKTSWVAYNGSTQPVPSAVLYDLAYFSSVGPTRDGRLKPEICASGFGVIAARSVDATWTASSIYRSKDGDHLAMWGTSMSAPHVAGAVALMLDKNPSLKPHEIKTLLTNSARSDSYTGSAPNDRWGHGKMNTFAAVQNVQPLPFGVEIFPECQVKTGQAGSTISYLLNVKNIGEGGDSYNLTTSGNSWKTTFWDASGTSQITNTGILASNMELQIMIKVEIPAGTAPAIIDLATIKATSTSSSSVINQALIKSYTPAALPWSDNFSTTKLDTTKWMVNQGPAEVNSKGLGEPSASYSLNLNGDERGGDDIQSQAIDLGGTSYVILSYHYQRTGGGDSPETGDDLWVDYYNSKGNWVNLKRYYGSGSDMSYFTKEQVTLPADAYHQEFKIRFRNVGTMGAFDDWFIDDVSLIPPATIPWSDNFPTTILDVTKWPYNSGPAAVNSVGINEPSTPYSLNLNSTDQVQSQLINLSGKTNVTLNYYYEKKGGGDSPEAGKDLFVDYANSAGNWINLKQHLGSSADMTNYELVQVNLPIEAHYGGFRIRFRTTGSYNADDWFVEDVLIKTLAEPDITVSPDSFEVTLDAGDSTSKTLTLGNVGQGGLTFMISMPPPGVNWLSFSPDSGTVTPGGSQSINVKFRSAGLTPGSIYHTKLIISSNNPDEPLVNIPVHLTVQSGTLLPTHFVFRDSTGESYSIVIDKATIEANLLQFRDEIGVFTPAGLCVGASVWTGTMPLALTAWKDDNQTPEVDGYKDGEKMYFRIWDASATMEYLATPTYSQGNGNFADGAYARISKLVADLLTIQIIPLNSGWSWISINVKPDTLDVAVVTRSLEHLDIMINGAGLFYIPGVVNSIGNINVLEGYKVHLNDIDTLVVRGQEVPVSTPIYLKTGWNFVSYLPTSPINAATALASVQANLAIAQNDEGKFYIPDVINSMGDMFPGEGYKLYLNAIDTLVYPAGMKLMKTSEPLAATHSVMPSHFKIATITDESYCVMIPEVQLEGYPISSNDEIGIFNEAGLCVGAACLTGNSTFAIATWQDDSQTQQIDGFQPGEKMIFKYWNAIENSESVMQATFQRGNGTFSQGDYSQVTLTSVAIPDNYALGQNFPNPFNAETSFKYQIPRAGKVSLVIYNLLGQEITRLIDKEQPAGYYSVHWDGKDALGRPVTSGVYIYRIETGSFADTKKLVIIK